MTALFVSSHWLNVGFTKMFDIFLLVRWIDQVSKGSGVQTEATVVVKELKSANKRAQLAWQTMVVKELKSANKKAQVAWQTTVVKELKTASMSAQLFGQTMVVKELKSATKRAQLACQTMVVRVKIRQYERCVSLANKLWQ